MNNKYMQLLLHNCYYNHCLSFQFTVKCHHPRKLYRGSATTDDEFGYFTTGGSNTVYSYELKTKEWGLLPPCPYIDSSLVTIDGALTAVGGSGDDGSFTDKLFTLRRNKWVEEFPPMNTACSDSAVVSTSEGKYIIVIGGYTGPHDWDATTTVELLQVRNRRWYIHLDGLTTTSHLSFSCNTRQSNLRHRKQPYWVHLFPATL